MENSNNIKTLIEEDLPMQIDCAQWHPDLDDILVVGAYQLSPQSTDVRLGHLYLLRLTPQVPGGFTVIFEYETAGGVLDLKFRKKEDDNSTILTAIATSSGLYLFNLVHLSEDDFNLEPISVIETKSMVLYLQWIRDDFVLFSDADGCVNAVENSFESNEWGVKRTKKVHESLTWTLHYCAYSNIIFSGSDCGFLTAFSMDDVGWEESPLFVKDYKGWGITSIGSFQNNVLDNICVSVGGYSDTLHIYSLLQGKTLSPLKSINLGGAIWRQVFLPAKDSVVVTMVIACARKGVKIVKYDCSKNEFQVALEVGKYDGFLAYGLDVKCREEKLVVASGYFDNHVVWVWEVQRGGF